MVDGYKEYDDGSIAVWADDSGWDDDTLEQLRKEYHIFYERGTYIPIMLYNFSKKHGGMVIFGFEDDDTLYFNKKNAKSFEYGFHSRVLGGIMKELNGACKYMKARGYQV